MSKLILDSNTYTSFVKGDEKVAEYLEKASHIYFSIIIIGELLAAFKKGELERKNKKVLGKFLEENNISVIDVSRETSDNYAEIKHSLNKRGTPIPTNDIWIAAHTVETGAKLVTYDKHFLKIPGLRVWDELKEKL